MLSNKKIHFNDLQRVFEKVQSELEEVNLLAEEEYLWFVDLVQSPIPSISQELGYVYDEGVTSFQKFIGYEEGVIYIPSYAPVEKYMPGGTLIDTIRHEYAHAWATLDRTLFKKNWFKKAFGLNSCNLID